MLDVRRYINISFSFFLQSLCQGVANYSQRAKSGPPLLFVNKILLEHNHTHLFIYGPWLLSHHNSWVRQVVMKTVQPAKPELFTLWVFFFLYSALIKHLLCACWKLKILCAMLFFIYIFVLDPRWRNTDTSVTLTLSSTTLSSLLLLVLLRNEVKGKVEVGWQRKRGSNGNSFLRSCCEQVTRNVNTFSR